MARPKTQQDLLKASQQSFDELVRLIDKMPERTLITEFDFSTLKNKNEVHWKRDKNLRDVLVHLHEWHRLLLVWVERNIQGNHQPFLPPPYNWKTYGKMNMEIWRKHQNSDLEDAKKWLFKSHQATQQLIASFTNEQLFGKNVFKWTGNTTLGSYCVSATSSHYEWAVKKLRAHIKITQSASETNTTK